MSDDWQPGDLALCVGDKRHWADEPHPFGFEPKIGGVYTVAKAGRAVFSNVLIIGFKEDAFGSQVGFVAANFRKIRPHKPDEEDAETIRLLNGVRQPA